MLIVTRLDLCPALRALAREFGLGKDCLSRPRYAHLPPQLKASLTTAGRDDRIQQCGRSVESLARVKGCLPRPISEHLLPQLKASLTTVDVMIVYSIAGPV